MHIEPGVVTGAKLALSYVTAAGCLGVAVKLGYNSVKQDGKITPFMARSAASTLLVFSFFEILPHFPVGVSEVHLILGSTLFLIFGAGPAAIGLMAGLLVQSLFFAPSDLPQYAMNITTLLVPLFGMRVVAGKVIRQKTAYKDIQYGQALALSTAYQAGIVTWVAFWAFYGHGFVPENVVQIASFSGVYLLVIVVEPVIDLAVLALAKTMSGLQGNAIFHQRLFRSAT